MWSLQISLATRDRIQTPSIYYPPVHISRPASASLSYHHRNRLTSRTNCSNFCHQTRRPLSADSRFGTKGSSSVKFNLGNVSFLECVVASSTTKAEAAVVIVMKRKKATKRVPLMFRNFFVTLFRLLSTAAAVLCRKTCEV